MARVMVERSTPNQQASTSCVVPLTEMDERDQTARRSAITSADGPVILRSLVIVHDPRSLPHNHDRRSGARHLTANRACKGRRSIAEAAGPGHLPRRERPNESESLRQDSVN